MEPQCSCGLRIMPSSSGIRACIESSIHLVRLFHLSLSSSIFSSAELEITVQMLVQIDKLVQLIESPVFTCKLHRPLCTTVKFTSSDLRLQLLEPDRYPHLFKCLYGLLMLLPQSTAFVSLRNRLGAVNSAGLLHMLPKFDILFLYFWRLNQTI